MTRVLVTGASGYIGGRAVQAFAVDRSLAVTAASRQTHRVPPGVTAAVVDWSNANALAALCRNQDAVIHLAAMNETACARDPEAAKRVNGGYTEMLLQAAITAGIRRFVSVSTAKVFGDNPSGTLDERCDPHPASVYSATHRLIEEHILTAHASGAIDGVVLRLSNAVGAPADAKTDAWMLIANDFCRQAAADGRITLRSSGRAWRNFIAMSDAVVALRHVLAVPRTALADGLFHLGGPQSIRILDFAERIASRARQMFGSVPQVHCAEAKAGEMHRVLDWRTAKLNATGWKAPDDLDAEIDATLALCRTAFAPVS